jgi:hypothetical protein
MSETMPTGIQLVFGMVKPQFERARSSATIRCGPLGMVVGTMVTERRELTPLTECAMRDQSGRMEFVRAQLRPDRGQR